MNKTILVGRLTKDPESRTTTGDNPTTVARFTIAVDRRGKDAGADFPSCVAFGKTAEFISKYFKKGSRIGITGRIQTGNYTNKDGVKVYTTDVVVEEAEFVENKSAAGEAEQSAPTVDSDGFMNIPDGIDEDLPFA